VEKVPGMLSVTLGTVVVSVMLTSVYVADASSSFCPFGQVMSEGGGWIVSDARAYRVGDRCMSPTPHGAELGRAVPALHAI
jgi:hypothetical protein